MKEPAPEALAGGTDPGIAVIGMAGRFPGAAGVEEFWRNLRDGRESIALLSEEALRAAGVSEAELRDPGYVRARGLLEEADLFDAAFFGLSPREAEIMDPQQRVFLECAWEALENAGCDPGRYHGLIGVYAGTSLSSYLPHVQSGAGRNEFVADYQAVIGNDKDFLTTRASYKLGLEGPSVVVQTACSTSLVATHLACQALFAGECDMALAGGVSVRFPQARGYRYQEGGILSPDGHCRAFDARAAGCVGGAGVGLVVLKRLEDAIAERDEVLAVIRGSAINNDGSLKIGYTAPRVDGEARVIRAAQQMAGVSPETITYVEAHGTGTPLGDPIEIAALTQVFRERTARRGFCAVGSVKTNIGHLDAAAGVAGLIKTVLMLRHRMIPPSLHYSIGNPEIDFEASPFFVSRVLSEWKSGDGPRRAGVSSFGIGGTNAHIVLEEAPSQRAAASGPDAAWPEHLVVLSARSRAALDRATRNLAAHLERHPELSAADVARTSRVGRREFSQRRMVVASDAGDLAAALAGGESRRVISGESAGSGGRSVYFMFSGQGSQYVRMARGLYDRESSFRDRIDACAEALKAPLGRDLRDLLYPRGASGPGAEEALRQTAIAQPALFALEYALAELWMKWGIEPAGMIGHSIGEYVAATLAGVFTVEAGLELVAARGRLMQQRPPGAMLAVRLPEEETRALLDNELDLAAVNGPSLCVVSGPSGAIERLQEALATRNVAAQLLHTSHAFHSAMMDPILEEFAARVASVGPRPPRRRFVSNRTGTWITDEEATRPEYWAHHLRHTVRFGDGVAELLKQADAAFLEVGPGHSLTGLVRSRPDRRPGQAVISSIRHPDDEDSDTAFLLGALGRLWLCGVPIDRARLEQDSVARRVPLPTYPFERKRFWIERGPEPAGRGAKDGHDPGDPDPAYRLYLPSWRRAAGGAARGGESFRYFLLLDEWGVGRRLADHLSALGHEVTEVSPGTSFGRLDERRFEIDPAAAGDYARLAAELAAPGAAPQRIIHLWSLTGHGPPTEDHERRATTRGFGSVAHLSRALSSAFAGRPLALAVVTNQTQDVTGEDELRPEKAPVEAACRVFPQETPRFECRLVDIVLPPGPGAVPERTVERLAAELDHSAPQGLVAYRGEYRWLRCFEPLSVEKAAGRPPRLRQGGTFLITGGLGRIGLGLAEYLARTAGARLILTGRAAFPERGQWEAWLSSHAEDDPVARKVRRLLGCEAAGGRVMVAPADVSDAAALRRVVEEGEARFGPIHGVVHAAGVVGKRILRPLAETEDADMQIHVPAKVRGPASLEEVLRGRALDFCMMFSSLSAVLGGAGYAAYAGANQYMDAFAVRRSRTDRAWVTVNWDGWQDVDGEVKGGLTPAEGALAFERVLAAAPHGQVIVSARSLDDDANAIAAPAAGSADEGGEHAPPLHDRPDMPMEYAPPRNQIERVIAEIWQEALGVSPVGIADTFLDLGGHSLVAIQIMSRVREAFQVDVPVRSLFESATVADLALEVVQRRAAGADAAALTEMLNEVEREPRHE